MNERNTAMKKLFSVLLALTLVLSMSMTAFAADTSPKESVALEPAS